MASTGDLIKQAVAGLQRELPALANLKIVLGLELRGQLPLKAGHRLLDEIAG